MAESSHQAGQEVSDQTPAGGDPEINGGEGLWTAFYMGEHDRTPCRWGRLAQDSLHCAHSVPHPWAETPSRFSCSLPPSPSLEAFFLARPGYPHPLLQSFPARPPPRDACSGLKFLLPSCPAPKFYLRLPVDESLDLGFLCYSSAAVSTHPKLPGGPPSDIRPTGAFLLWPRNHPARTDGSAHLWKVTP